MKAGRIAGIYDFLVHLIFGNELISAASFFTDRIRPGSRILIIGGGTGRILEKLNSRSLTIDYVELSEEMIRKSKKRQAGNITVNYIKADILHWECRFTYDAIITPFVLDCFRTEELERLIPRLASSLNQAGEWHFSDFVTSRGWWKSYFILAMYKFFNITSGLKTDRLPGYDKAFQLSGLTLRHEAHFFHYMVASRLYRF